MGRDAEVIASFYAGRDNRGYKRNVRWLQSGDYVTLQLLKNNREDTRINWNKDIISDLFQSLVDVRSQITDEQINLVQPTTGLDRDQKIELMNELANSMTQDELEGFKQQADEDITMVLKDCFGEDEPRWYTRDKVEKTKEMVLEDIYQEFGFETFTPTQFKELYQYKYEKNEYQIYLQRLSGDWLRRNPVDGKEKYGNGDITYEYQLGSMAEDVINQYGSFLSEDYPLWSRKKNMLPEDKRPE